MKRIVVLALAIACEAEAAPSDPHANVALETAACAPCHAEVVDEWRGSMHAAAWDDPVFQAEYAVTPEAFCRGCHAPQQHEGIGCASCHESVAPFAASVEADACGRCHDFAVPPGSHSLAPGDPLQSTLHEWRESKNGRSCVDCHMPMVDGRRSHRLRGLHDREFLASAVRVDVEATRVGDFVHVLATVRPRRIGHAFPTGDMFRAAKIFLTSGEATAEATMRRTFAPRPTDDGELMRLREIADSRIMPGSARTFEVWLPAANEVTWSLVLDRLDPRNASRRGLEIEDVRILIAHRRVAIGSLDGA